MYVGALAIAGRVRFDFGSSFTVPTQIVFVPMLLESDPKPLGEDVSVRIPPVDDGKFVNRLNDASKAPSAKSTAPKNDARSDMKPEVKAEPAKSEPAKAEAPKTEPPKAEAAKAETVTPAPASATASAAPAQSLAPPTASAPVVAAASNAPPTQSEPPLSGFSVQLAAFLDDKGANSLTNKLKKAGQGQYKLVQA